MGAHVLVAEFLAVHLELVEDADRVVALGLGSALGALLALRIQMTAMPQMVALLNGFGGAASALVAGAELWSATEEGRALSGVVPIAIVLSV